MKGHTQSNEKNVSTSSKKGRVRLDSKYSYYVLFLLFLFNVLNYLDRSVLAILAEDIKADLALSDSQLGFLSGTIFSVFYATFGMALGRLADVWNRTRLISIGLAGWSCITALSGLSRGMLPLALCRFGVAIGEAGASPAAYSLIYDCFSTKRRTTALAIFTTAISIGGGLGLYVGGLILDTWNTTWPNPALAPFGLHGWQATFIIVGLPGVLLALWMSTLREPIRGNGDGILTETHPHPFKESAKVLLSMIPVLNWRIMLSNPNGKKSVRFNVLAGIGIATTVYLLIIATNNTIQWVAFGIGVYAAFSWAQGIKARDIVVFSMIFRCRALISLIIAQSSFASIIAGFAFWAVPYFQRFHGLESADVGTVLGFGGALVGITGLLIGGMLADKLAVYTGRAKVYVWLVSSSTAVIAGLIFLLSQSVIFAYAALLCVYFFMSVAGAPVISSINDLVLPRGRATTSAFAFMATNFIGGAIAPFLIGWLSDGLATSNLSEGESLQHAMLWSLVVPALAIIPALYALKNIESDQKTLVSRAQKYGEEVKTLDDC